MSPSRIRWNAHHYSGWRRKHADASAFFVKCRQRMACCSSSRGFCQNHRLFRGRGGLSPRMLFLRGRQLEAMYRPCYLDARTSAPR